MNTVLKARYSNRHNTQCFSVHVFFTNNKNTDFEENKVKERFGEC